MKKSVIALLTAATLSSSAFAAVSDAQFQWGGLIPPAENIVPEVCIDNTGIVDHKNGVLEFTNDGDKITLVDASDLSFKVMDQNCDETAATPAKDIAYKYTLKTTAVSVGGITDTDPTSPLQKWLHVTADGTKLTHNVQSGEIAAGVSTVLSVKQTADLPATDALYEEVSGQDVLVLALVEVTNEI
ncbi:hypothetical protein ACPSL3_07615 [Vibrio owensii]|uniref:hypothetical protein n=1 Tax=Vibrio owensii TaxID=696485 RepID=UPI003CE4990D